MNFSLQDKQQIKQDLYLAYYDCRRHKRNTSNALAFEIHLERNMENLYQNILSMNYTPNRCVVFIVHCPVVREIFAADFRDRIVHHFIFNRLNPFIDRLFIYDSYSCRKAKGTLFGIKRAEHFVRACSLNYSRDCYVLKLDVLGFFMHINRDLLCSMVRLVLERYYTCSDKNLLIYLCEQVILQDPTEECVFKGRFDKWNKLPKTKSLFCVAKTLGLPIGNLTSQLFANLYLNGLDHFIKRKLKVRYYGRYVDDMLLVGQTKEELCSQRDAIKTYLQVNLGLDIHPKKEYLQHYSKGFSFLGAQIMPYRRYIGQRSVKKLNYLVRDRNALRGFDLISEKGKGLEQQNMRIISYLGLMKHFKSYRFLKHLERQSVSNVYDSLFAKMVDC